MRRAATAIEFASAQPDPAGHDGGRVGELVWVLPRVVVVGRQRCRRWPWRRGTGEARCWPPPARLSAQVRAAPIARFIQPHPTLSESFGETVLALTGRGLHLG